MSSSHRRSDYRLRHFSSETSSSSRAVTRSSVRLHVSTAASANTESISRLETTSDGVSLDSDEESVLPNEEEAVDDDFFDDLMNSPPAVGNERDIGVHPNRSPLELSPTEEGMIEIIRYLDATGCPRGLYDSITSILKRRSSNGFDIRSVYSRDVLIKKLGSHLHIQPPIHRIVRGYAVYRFSFKTMLQDLFDSPVFDSVDNLCVNPSEDSRFSQFVPDPNTNDELEIMSRSWSKSTFDQCLSGFVPGKDLFCPLILYADKTGTDHFQRYPLEPWMFTTALIRRNHRQNADNWRHIGFIPPVEEFDDTTDTADDDAEVDPMHFKGTSHQNLQLYHDFLYSILTDLRGFQTSIPEMNVNLGGIRKTVRVHIHVATILGDQLSQDTVCGRIGNNTSTAGRVHRACMCSASHASDAVAQSCKELIAVRLVDELNSAALLSTDAALEKIKEDFPSSTSASRKQIKIASDFIKVKVKLATKILAKPYSLHPLRNGFRGIKFGSNERNVFEATVEDHLHSMEAGVIMYANNVLYGSLTDAEGKKFDKNLRKIQSGSRSSLSTLYPHVKIKKNFNSQSLMTHKEKVGSLFNSLLGLHTSTG